MNERLVFNSIMAALLIGGVATGCDGDGGTDGGTIVLDDADIDTGTGDDDSGTEPDTGVSTGMCTLPARVGAPGGACRSGTACLPGNDCIEESAGSVPSRTPEGTNGPMVMVTFSPGGVCSPPCETDDDCDDCTSCVGASAGDPGTCASNCTPTATDNGMCRDGYACGFGGTCGLACQNDDFCRIQDVIDFDGDGMLDGYLVDPDSPQACDTTTGRCGHPGTAGAVAGDNCENDWDCEANGICITGEGWPGGYCARLGCEYPGFECDGAGETCDVGNFGISICTQGCQVGAEDASAQAGVGGGGAGCPTEFGCFWNGTGAADANPNGSCIPAEYNDIAAPNIGTRCANSGDCYSPLGRGRCLFADEEEGLAGYCVVSGCVGMEVRQVMPGVAVDVDICPETALCVNFGSADAPNPLCVQNCDTGDDCPTGFACANLLSGGGGLCWPNCFEADDCPGSEMCVTQGTTRACDADGPDNMPNTDDDEICECTERGAAPPDSGVMDTDAGAGDAGV